MLVCARIAPVQPNHRIEFVRSAHRSASPLRGHSAEMLSDRFTLPNGPSPTRR